MLSAVVLVCVAMATVGATVIPAAEFGTVPQKGTPVAKEGPTPSENFPFHDELTDDYTLYWNFNDTHITFEVIVKTTGWVGFGISPKGAMKSSDVIIGWVKDGQTHFADRHAEGHFLPAEDSSQDWTLLMAREDGEYTVLKVVRQLDTCDDQDVPILNGTTRVIFAYNTRDPSSDDAVSYHGSTRGTKSVLLLEPPSEEQQESSLPSDVTTLEFKNRNFSVPSSDTTYWCSYWKLPDLGRKRHVIRYEPIIQTGHETLLHHVILWYCQGGLDERSLTGSADFDCYGNKPEQAERCSHVFVAWAIGGKTFNYPSHVGYSLGSAGDPGYFMMETHYDNPGMRSDFVDNSGLRVYLTSQLRQYDAGVLMAGVHVDSYQIIPPYEDNFLSQGFCEEACLAESLGDKEIYVIANVLHAHLLGAKLRTRHIRNGTELDPIQEDNNYDFNYQEARKLKSERTIKKGDSLLVECNYDSTGRTQVTYGGLSSRQEMCLSFLIYYPRSQLSECTSRILHNIPAQYGGSDIFGVLRRQNWLDKSAHENFRKLLDSSRHGQACHGSQGPLKSNLKAFDPPKIAQTSTQSPKCHS